MPRPGASRRRIAQALQVAYGDGLISHDTLVSRLDGLLGSTVIDPRRLVGDLAFRVRRPRWSARLTELRESVARRAYPVDEPLPLLALDWTGPDGELVVGRHGACDVVLDEGGVSRSHARLVLRDGVWSVHDLGSTNGTYVNGRAVGRCEVLPGDRITFGTRTLMID